MYILLLNILLSILIDAFLEVRQGRLHVFPWCSASFLGQVRKSVVDKEPVWTSIIIYLLPFLEKGGRMLRCQ